MSSSQKKGSDLGYSSLDTILGPVQPTASMHLGSQNKHRAYLSEQNKPQLEDAAINDALPLKAAKCNAKLKSYLGFSPELQRSPLTFHIDLLTGATLMPLTACMKQNTD